MTRHRVVTYNVERGRHPGTVAEEIRTLARTHDVLLLQETQGYFDVLKSIRGFRLVGHRGAERDEATILVRATLNLGEQGIRRVTSRGWFTVRGGKTPPKWAPHATVDGIEYVSVHTPPSVDSRWKRIHSPRRWRAYRELVGNLESSPRCVIAGDWNAVPGKYVGHWLAVTLAHIELRRHVPGAGTHGRRCIDYVFARGVKVSAVRALPHRGSDHRPVSFVVTHKEPS